MEERYCRQRIIRNQKSCIYIFILFFQQALKKKNFEDEELDDFEKELIAK